MKYYLIIVILGFAWQSIAALCPVTEGFGVYAARSILEKIGNYEYDDLSNCLRSEGRSEPTAVETDSSDFTVQPNPASSFLRIELSQPAADDVSFIIFDLAGKIILFGDRSAESGKLNIALDNVNNGLYIIQIEAKDGTTYPAKKIIVLK